MNAVSLSKNSGDVLATFDFNSEISALETHSTSFFISTTCGNVYTFYLVGFRLVSTIKLHDTFAQSSMMFTSGRMLLACQDGRIYRANPEDGLVNPKVATTGQTNIRHLIPTVNGTFVLSCSNKVIAVIMTKVGALGTIARVNDNTIVPYRDLYFEIMKLF